MKRIFTIVLFIVIFIALSVGYTQEVINTNQATVTWDEVTGITGVVSYEVFARNRITLEEASLTFVNVPPVVVTTPGEGDWDIGVRTIRQIDGKILYSIMNWSNVNGVWTSNPFFLRHYIPPEAPKNLRPL